MPLSVGRKFFFRPFFYLKLSSSINLIWLKVDEETNKNRLVRIDFISLANSYFVSGNMRTFFFGTIKNQNLIKSQFSLHSSVYFQRSSAQF